MNSYQQKIEHHYAQLTGLFAIFFKKKKWKILSQQGGLLKRIIILFFIMNVHTCFNGNTVSTRLDMVPLSLDEYLGGVIPPFEGNIGK